MFQQDNDPNHTSDFDQEWFLRNKIKIIPWPSQSSDLNPIEMLWTDIEKVIKQKKKQQILLKKILFTAIRNLVPLERSSLLVDSMPRRCAKVIKKFGYLTKY